MKPLGMKAYGHIGHLPNSRMGPGDHRVHEGQESICTAKPRDKHDVIIVQEKADGSCCSVARVGDQILALGRAGYLAQTSKYEQHQLFADWVRRREAMFRDVLSDGERLVGEWLAQAHGTRYLLPHEPWVVFDLMRGHDRATRNELTTRCTGFVVIARTVSVGVPCSVESAMALVTLSAHGAIDPVEGAVWRVERKGEVDFLAKYVRPDKVDGCYLPEVSGKEAVWNWRPS